MSDTRETLSHKAVSLRKAEYAEIKKDAKLIRLGVCAENLPYQLRPLRRITVKQMQRHRSAMKQLSRLAGDKKFYLARRGRIKAGHLVKKLVGCARCGGEHRNMRFHKLKRPCGDLTHWTLCPTTAEPIMMLLTR